MLTAVFQVGGRVVIRQRHCAPAQQLRYGTLLCWAPCFRQIKSTQAMLFRPQFAAAGVRDAVVFESPCKRVSYTPCESSYSSFHLHAAAPA